MSEVKRYSDYDDLAWFYNRYWSQQYHQKAILIVKRLLLERLPAPAEILDLCCGTGHLTKIVRDLGYQVTGIDGSTKMLQYAREKVPDGRFLLLDARSFSLPAKFDAVISTFESLNHIMHWNELLSVFKNAHNALKVNGTLLFDMLLENAYLTQWKKSSGIIDHTNACIIKGGYNPETRTGRTQIAMYRLRSSWERSDVLLFQKCYGLPEIQLALTLAGFSGIHSYDAVTDLGMEGDLAVGRTFFTALKNSFLPRYQV